MAVSDIDVFCVQKAVPNRSCEDVMNGNRISFLNLRGYELAFLPRPRCELVCIFVVDSLFRPFDIHGAM